MQSVLISSQRGRQSCGAAAENDEFIHESVSSLSAYKNSVLVSPSKMRLPLRSFSISSGDLCVSRARISRILVLQKPPWQRPRLLSNMGRTNLYFSFKVNFDQAEAYRKSTDQYLRAKQWEDLTVEVFI